MFSFGQNKNNNSFNFSQDDEVVDVVSPNQYRSYVSQDQLVNEIFNTEKSYDDIPEDLDISFAQNFNSKGGKFIYCLNAVDLISKLESFLNTNGLTKPFVWEDELYPFLKQKLNPSFSLERSLDEAKCAISLCESLIAEEGSLIINPNQNRFRPLDGFPNLHIILTSKSNVKQDIDHAVSDFLKKHSDFFPFIIDLSKVEKPTRFASNKPVLNSRGTKQIIVFYCEESIFGE